MSLRRKRTAFLCSRRNFKGCLLIVCVLRLQSSRKAGTVIRKTSAASCGVKSGSSSTSPPNEKSGKQPIAELLPARCPFLSGGGDGLVKIEKLLPLPNDCYRACSRLFGESGIDLPVAVAEDATSGLRCFIVYCPASHAVYLLFTTAHGFERAVLLGALPPQIQHSKWRRFCQYPN